MGRFRVAICGRSSADIEREILENVAEVTVVNGDITTEDALLTYAGDAHALLLGSIDPVTRRVIEGVPNLRILARYGIGLDNIDIAAATEHGVVFANDPDYALEEVADHAFTLALALTRRIVKMDRMMRENRSGHEIQRAIEPIHANSSLTFGLLGLGNIARRVATRAKALGFKVISYDPLVPKAEFGLLGVLRVVTLEELFRSADIVSIHVPLLPQTRHMVGTEQFSIMKSGSFIVNTSRGPVIDQVALVDAIRRGRICGAGLDVFEQEPLPLDDILRKLENVVLTPHIAWYSEESQRRVKQDMARAVLATLSGGSARVRRQPSGLQTRKDHLGNRSLSSPTDGRKG
jgi:D-3-phosphoglycerate dehydrogenase